MERPQAHSFIKSLSKCFVSELKLPQSTCAKWWFGGGVRLPNVSMIQVNRLAPVALVDYQHINVHISDIFTALRSPTNSSVSQSGEQRISTKLQRLGFHGNITTATRPLIFTHHFPQTSLFFCRLARSGHPIHNTTYLLFTTYDDLCHLPLLNHR